MTEAELHAEHRRALLAWDATLDCASRNLAASKKLSREVEQALRKIREGLGVFNDYWNKTLQAPVRPAWAARFAESAFRDRGAKRMHDFSAGPGRPVCLSAWRLCSETAYRACSRSRGGAHT
jgi:hypothetical protein